MEWPRNILRLWRGYPQSSGPSNRVYRVESLDFVLFKGIRQTFLLPLMLFVHIINGPSRIQLDIIIITVTIIIIILHKSVYGPCGIRTMMKEENNEEETEEGKISII